MCDKPYLQCFSTLDKYMHFVNTFTQTEISYWTNQSTSGPAVLATDAEIEESAAQCLKPLLDIVSQYDGFLIAAYTLHPLLPMLQLKVGRKPVVGMFQASLTTALHLLTPRSKFAIITTGSGFIEHLDNAVKAMLGIGTGESSIFAGVAASGITWDVLTREPKDVAIQMMIDTVREAVKGGDVGVVCLGGAILVGMASWAEEACILELGEEKGRRVKIVDPLLPGVVTVDGFVRMLQLNL
jgi:Asp/Glu/hydantoin racemase